MTTRHTLYVLLAAVSVAAAVLSFAALRDLALLCGFSPRLAWLLPVVVDAGAAAGSLVWLGGHGDTRAQRFACRLALVLLASSVAANAVSHGLAAYELRPAWWVVVIVSAVAPGVLGATVHLSVLVGRSTVTGHGRQVAPLAAVQGGDEVAAGGRPVFVPLAAVRAVTRSAQVTTPATTDTTGGGEPVETWEAKRDRLLAEGVGRKILARELGLRDHEARRLLARRGDQVAAEVAEVAG